MAILKSQAHLQIARSGSIKRRLMEISSKNVGRIAERIAMNELEARGFHIVDLAYMSKTSANVDFMASRDGRSFNIQVKGASNAIRPENPRWAVQYGYCDDDIVERRQPFFNRKTNFALRADVIVLIAVKSPSEYQAVVMPVAVAEEAAQLNLSGYYRLPKANGGKRLPNKVWTDLEAARNPRKLDPFKDKERAILRNYKDAWDRVDSFVLAERS